MESPCGTVSAHCYLPCTYVNPSLPFHPCVPLGIRTFVLYICFCFANKSICTIFLNSTHGQYYIFVFKVQHIIVYISTSFLFFGGGGLPWWLRWQRICPQCGRPGFNPWVGKIPWRRKWQLTPEFLPGEFHGQRSLVGYIPWDCKELDMTERLTLHSFLRLNNILLWDFPGGSVVKNLPAVQESQVPPLGWEDPLEEEMATHSSILDGNSHGQRRLVNCVVHGFTKESDMSC